MEWGALLIPAIAAIVLKVFWPKKIDGWEIVLPVVPVLICIPILRASTEYILTHDNERWGGWAVTAHYYEPWNEWITQTCSYTTSCGKDCTTTVYYDCSYCLHHPAYWEVLGSNGETVSIDQLMFDILCNQFGNKEFVDMHRHYYTLDGDQYKTTWRGSRSTIQPVFSTHGWKNKTLANSGVFEFPKVSKEEAEQLYTYPSLKNALNDPAILGGAFGGTGEADKELQVYNALLGAKKQVRIWLLLFENKPLSTALLQESYWKGGKNNEVTVCLGTKGDKVEWVYSFCFIPEGNTSNGIMKQEIRDTIVGKKLDLKEVVNIIGERVDKYFTRKKKAEWEYLKTEIPISYTVVIYIMTLGITIGISYYAVVNDFDEDGKKTGRVLRELSDSITGLFRKKSSW